MRHLHLGWSVFWTSKFNIPPFFWRHMRTKDTNCTRCFTHILVQLKSISSYLWQSSGCWSTNNNPVKLFNINYMPIWMLNNLLTCKAFIQSSSPGGKTFHAQFMLFCLGFYWYILWLCFSWKPVWSSLWSFKMYSNIIWLAYDNCSWHETEL